MEAGILFTVNGQTISVKGPAVSSLLSWTHDGSEVFGPLVNSLNTGLENPLSTSCYEHMRDSSVVHMYWLFFTMM